MVKRANQNWPKLHLAQVELSPQIFGLAYVAPGPSRTGLSRKRRWPKSKLAKVERAGVLCTVGCGCWFHGFGGSRVVWLSCETRELQTCTLERRFEVDAVALAFDQEWKRSSPGSSLPGTVKGWCDLCVWSSFLMKL